MPEQTPDEIAEEFWRGWAENSEAFQKLHRQHKMLGLLPSEPRCSLCHAPFAGVGGVIVKILYQKDQSKMNPLLCNACEQFAEQYQGGAEVNLAMFFADIRGSTALSETMSPVEFSRLINRFYITTTRILIPTLAIIDKLIGDEVSAYFATGYSGPDYIKAAIESGIRLLEATGHGDKQGPWVPVGVGINHGLAFFGAMGTREGVIDITALGDSVNTAARLASHAGQGEVLVSQAAVVSAGVKADHLERRALDLKGIAEPVIVRIFHAGDKVEALVPAA